MAWGLPPSLALLKIQVLDPKDLRKASGLTVGGSISAYEDLSGDNSMLTIRKPVPEALSLWGDQTLK